MGFEVRSAGVCARLAGLVACIASVLSPLAAGAAGWDSRVSTGFEIRGETALAGPGEFDFWLTWLEGEARRDLDERVELVLAGDFRVIGYDFDGSPFAPLPEPWEQVHVLRLRPSLEIGLSDAWSLVAGPIFEISRESEADVSDALRGGGAFAVGYRSGDGLEIALGLIVQSEIEDDAYLAPYVRLDIPIVAGLHLTARSETSRGGDAELVYRFLEDFELAFGGGYRRERFRLNDDGTRPRRKGVGEEESSFLAARFAWTVVDPVRLEAYIGTTLDGEVRLEDRRGHKLADADYDAAPFGGLRIGVRF